MCWHGMAALHGICHGMHIINGTWPVGIIHIFISLYTYCIHAFAFGLGMVWAVGGDLQCVWWRSGGGGDRHVSDNQSLLMFKHNCTHTHTPASSQEGIPSPPGSVDLEWIQWIQDLLTPACRSRSLPFAAFPFPESTLSSHPHHHPSSLLFSSSLLLSPLFFWKLEDKF